MARSSEAVGAALGWLVAPLFGAASLVRRARPVHPAGQLYEGHVEREVLEGPYVALAERLRGPALVRFSRAFFRAHRARPDLFGCAVRFRSDVVASPEPRPGDQDLLFTTLRSLWTLPIAALATDHDDFLANDYYGVSPFELEGVGIVYVRLEAEPVESTGVDAEARLDDAVRRGAAALHLEIAREPRGHYERVARIVVEGRSTLDGEAVRFHPAVAGRGIRARGAVQRLRMAPYAVSQRLRPRHGARR